MYNDSNITQWQGRAVILYTNKDNKKMVVWCHDKNEICSVAMVRINSSLTVVCTGTEIKVHSTFTLGNVSI